jgi:hypothetical protein
VLTVRVACSKWNRHRCAPLLVSVQKQTHGPETQLMSTNTLLLIIVVVLLLGGGGFYFR